MRKRLYEWSRFLHRGQGPEDSVSQRHPSITIVKFGTPVFSFRNTIDALSATQPMKSTQPCVGQAFYFLVMHDARAMLYY